MSGTDNPFQESSKSVARSPAKKTSQSDRPLTSTQSEPTEPDSARISRRENRDAIRENANIMDQLVERIDQLEQQLAQHHLNLGAGADANEQAPVVGAVGGNPIGGGRRFPDVPFYYGRPGDNFTDWADFFELCARALDIPEDRSMY